MEQSKLINHKDLQTFVRLVFKKAGLDEEGSNIVARHLVLANLRGIDSHGVTRVKNYVERIENEIVNKTPGIEIIKETASFAHIDGRNQLGILSATEAMKIAVDKAINTGIAVVGVKNSNHCGMLADYTNYAAENDCISFMTTNAPPNMAPWGGKERYLGTNPLSYGVPGYNNEHIIFDMATSVVARGKIKLAIKNNEGIPIGWQ